MPTLKATKNYLLLDSRVRAIKVFSLQTFGNILFLNYLISL